MIKKKKLYIDATKSAALDVLLKQFGLLKYCEEKVIVDDRLCYTFNESVDDAIILMHFSNSQGYVAGIDKQLS